MIPIEPGLGNASEGKMTFDYYLMPPHERWFYFDLDYVISCKFCLR